MLGQKPELCITQIIQGLPEAPEEPWDCLASYGVKTFNAQVREHELEKVLLEYDEEDIVMAKVLSEHFDGEIMKAYISIAGHEKILIPE